ncbi:MAG: FHA domain-containing protein [Zoogloeaceae bacterium]|nr:FHA domain-containing protein [Zoogloeaceae bacterium]
MITIVRGEIGENPSLVVRVGLKEAGHALERCLNRVKNTGEGFRGRLSGTAKNGQVSFVFDSPAEACLAAIEMQRRTAELMPTSGIRLGLRLAVLSAENEAEANQQVDKLLEMSLPYQILCSRQVLMEVAVSVGLKVTDQKQKLKLAENSEPIRVMQLLWHENDDSLNGETRVSDDDLPATLTSTSLLAQAAMTDGSATIPPTPPVRPIRLLVRYGDHSLILDEKTPNLTIGREHHNDIAINDNRASRQHARLERRDGYYWLADLSTNGTFIAFAGEPEVFLRKDSLALRGKGALSFGISTRDPEAEPLDFEHI